VTTVLTLITIMMIAIRMPIICPRDSGHPASDGGRRASARVWAAASNGSGVDRVSSGKKASFAEEGDGRGGVRLDPEASEKSGV